MTKQCLYQHETACVCVCGVCVSKKTERPI